VLIGGRQRRLAEQNPSMPIPAPLFLVAAAANRGTETSAKEGVATSRFAFRSPILRIMSTLCPSVDRLGAMTQPRRICMK
jgi:hypothetical protein